MDITSMLERRAPSGESGVSRRGLLMAAASLLAGSCVSSGPAQPGRSEDEEVAEARAAAGEALPPPRRFSAWNAELRASAPGRDVVLVDLDAVDSNIDVIKSQIGPAFALRLVTKSLPSLDLIAHLMASAGTDRLMAFSEGMLRALLRRFGSGVDILLGRPMPVEGAVRALSESPEAAKRVRWLIDTRERMLEYTKLAAALHHPLDVAIELDVGLRRGGARTTSELMELLEIVASRPKELRFVGFMGYDGHVPFAPPGFDSDTEFAAVQDRYADFVQAASAAFPALLQGPLVHNSGGSATYYRYGAGLATPVNEIALGSAFLLPARFNDLAALGLTPALFMASPVLKRIDPAELPFVPGYLPQLAQSDRTLEIAYFMLAAGFPGDIVYPAGLAPNPFIPEGEGVENLLPNQVLRNGSSDVPLRVGDFVFFQAWQGDGLAWLDAAELLRDDRIADRWPTFRDGCLKGCGGP